MGVTATLAVLMLLGGQASSPATPATPPGAQSDSRSSAARPDPRSPIPDPRSPIPDPQYPTPDPPSPIPDPQPPVSLERVHEGLQRPTLKIPPIDPLPVFRGSVEVDLPLDTPLEAMRRELAEDSGYSGRRGVDVLGAVMGIVKRVKAARRARAEAEIRQEVQAELNAFCAEHDCSVLESGPPPIEGIVLPRRSER